VSIEIFISVTFSSVVILVTAPDSISRLTSLFDSTSVEFLRASSSVIGPEISGIFSGISPFWNVLLKASSALSAVS
jgi:hypothetical protein